MMYLIINGIFWVGIRSKVKAKANKGEYVRKKTLRSIGTSLYLVFAVTMISGCVTQGRNFETQVGWIKSGETRKQDVSRVLKAPYSVGNSSGMQTWTYGYYKYRVFGKSHIKEIKFYWNADQTVNRFSFNSSFPGDIKKSKSGGLAK